jgi:non-ribosomal peptide synthetase component F
MYCQGLDISPLLANDFSLVAVYSSEAISEAEVNSMLDHFEAALIFMTNHPHDILGDATLVNAKERECLVTDLSSEEQLSPTQNISELIEMQANQTPEKIAVCLALISLCVRPDLIMCVQLQFDQDVFLTYRQMDSLSNDLARMLITRGVRRGTLVALYMDKSIEMFLSILAIHKAGGGYVPLDPEHPAERIQIIVRRAQSPMVLTTRELENQLDSALLDSGIGSVLVDFTKLSPATKPDVGVIGRDDICHVLFTSGSTGTPKGIQFVSLLSMSN